MQLRLPWLRSRLPLLAIAAWDALSILCSYSLVYRLRLGSWWGQSDEAFGFAIGWVCLSYLVGRYSKESFQQPLRKPWRSQTLLVVLLLLVGIQLHSWLFRVLLEETRFRGFLAPFLSLTAFVSLAAQGWARQRFYRLQQNWLLVVSRKERLVLEQELQIDRLRFGREMVPCAFCSLDQMQDALCDGFLLGVAVSKSTLQRHPAHAELLRARQQGLKFRSLDHWCEDHLQRIPPELFDPDELLVGEGFQLRPGTFNWRLKRFGDLLGSGLLLLVASPLLLVAMLLVKLGDGGPIFYFQTRTGLFGKELRIIKLRTMLQNSETNGAQWSPTNDPRITTVGRWLRRFRIDELPQLWCVLTGEMTLIGPRPERPSLEAGVVRAIPNYCLRHWLRPGLSGWAQVCFPYGASIADTRMKLSYDLYYLRNANLLLDLLIVLKTIKLVAGGRGAEPD
jgi:lipopolysaccharide/colanic/teichoic acid biosynthesis glycosyltransferase